MRGVPIDSWHQDGLIATALVLNRVLDSALEGFPKEVE